jgi:hypothetical protein
MGRHSAPDDDPDTSPDTVAEDANGAAIALDEDPAAGRRGRHARVEDVEDTGPVPGAEMRSADERAAAQDERPTQRLVLDELLNAEPLAADEAGPTEVGSAPELGKPSKPAKPPKAPKAPEPAKQAKPKAPRGAQSTAADLELIRRHPEVRNRILGAVLAPFVVYLAVMLLLGASGVQYLLWIWIPLVTAGVLAGLILDSAHRRAAPESPPENPSGEASDGQ